MEPVNEFSMDPLNDFHILLLQRHENFYGPFW